MDKLKGGSTEKGDDLEAVQSLLDMSSLLDRINKIDLKKIEEKIEENLSPNDRLIRDLKANRTVKRVVKGKGRYKANLHWKTKAHRRKKYYAMVGAPRRREGLAEMISTPEGWYEYIVTSWKKHGTAYRLTREEWIEHVAPLLGGRVPVLRRYSTRKPFSLENMYVVNMDDSKDVIFEGADYKLRLLGACL